MADSIYNNVEGVADETTASAGNSQMTPIVTGGTVTVDSATFTNWPLEGKTRSVRYDATSGASGGCYSSVNPGSPSGGWERLIRAHFESAPAVTMTFWQLRTTVVVGELRMTAGRVIQVYNAANALIYSFAALTFPGSYYIGIYTNPDPSVGQITIRIWTAAGALVEQYTTSSANTGAAALVSERLGSKINSGTFVWTAWFGQVDHNHTSETALTLSPPISDPVGAYHVDGGWIEDDTTDASAGTLSISNVVLDPAIDYLIDNTNHRIAVRAATEPIDFSYRVTNATTTRFVTITGTIAALEGSPNPAVISRRVSGVLVPMFT